MLHANGQHKGMLLTSPWRRHVPDTPFQRKHRGREGTACSARAKQLVEECDGLLVVGSSLMVYSAFRLARAAASSGAQLALLSVGPTRADDLASIKVDDPLRWFHAVRRVD